MKYKQLPLNGDRNDFGNSLDILKGTTDINKAITKFFEENKEYNPIQLKYILFYLMTNKELDILVDWSE